MRLLREFIGAMFGLDRHVTMNALSDVVGGPDPTKVRPPIPSLRDSIQDHPSVGELAQPNGPPHGEFDALGDDPGTEEKTDG